MTIYSFKWGALEEGVPLVYHRGKIPGIYIVPGGSEEHHTFFPLNPYEAPLTNGGTHVRRAVFKRLPADNCIPPYLSQKMKEWKDGVLITLAKERCSDFNQVAILVTTKSLQGGECLGAIHCAEGRWEVIGSAETTTEKAKMVSLSDGGVIKVSLTGGGEEFAIVNRKNRPVSLTWSKWQEENAQGSGHEDPIHLGVDRTLVGRQVASFQRRYPDWRPSTHP